MGTLNHNLNLNIIDNFYSDDNFSYMLTCSMLNPCDATHQPHDTFVYSRTNAYRCHQTKSFNEKDKKFSIFVDTFFLKTGIKIKKLHTFFRKIYVSEIQNILKYRLPSHRDPSEFNVAGVIYLNNFGLDDGTGLFTMGQDQIEPDIIVGAKPNRCVFYDSQIFHTPLQSKDTEMRLIQPFFITYE